MSKAQFNHPVPMVENSVQVEDKLPTYKIAENIFIAKYKIIRSARN